MTEFMTRLYVEFFFFFFVHVCAHTDCESHTHAFCQLEKAGTQRQLQQIQGVMQYCDQHDTYYHDCDVIGACMMQMHAFFYTGVFCLRRTWNRPTRQIFGYHMPQVWT